MRAVFLLLLLAPVAAATQPSMASDTLAYSIDGGPDLHRIAFDVTERNVSVAAPDAGPGRLEFIVMIGDESAPEPNEWYVIHLGRNDTAADHTGATLRVERDMDVATVARGSGAAGDCLVLYAERWERIDGEKVILASAPADATPATAWGDGHNCHVQDGEQASAPEPEKATPMTPWLAAIGLLAAIAIRRR